MALNIEEDVNALLYFYSEEWKPSQLADVLVGAIDTHGTKNLLENLNSRSKTPLIRDLIDLLEPLEDM